MRCEAQVSRRQAVSRWPGLRIRLFESCESSAFLRPPVKLKALLRFSPALKFKASGPCVVLQWFIFNSDPMRPNQVSLDFPFSKFRQQNKRQSCNYVFSATNPLAFFFWAFCLAVTTRRRIHRLTITWSMSFAENVPTPRDQPAHDSSHIYLPSIPQCFPSNPPPPFEWFP